jgi:hypothetical protein
MSYVFASPDGIAAAAGDLTTIGSTINVANAAAARSTTQIVAAAQDEVSAAIAALFGGYGQEYQALSAQTALFHDEFLQALTSGGFRYAATEAANASGLQTLVQDVLDVINAPTEALFGRPLIGNGTNGAPGTGQPGGPGGIVLGNGGNGGSGAPGQAGGRGGTFSARRIRPCDSARAATTCANRTATSPSSNLPRHGLPRSATQCYAPVATWLACTSSAARASVCSLAQR